MAPVARADWSIARSGDRLRYDDRAGTLDLPLPGLDGPHQIDNAGLAVAVLRVACPGLEAAAFNGIARTRWPARMQRLQGRLAATMPPGWELWLDGGHNPGAGLVLAETVRGWSDRPLHLLVGMKQSKDPAGFLTPLLPLADTVWAVREPGQHEPAYRAGEPVRAFVDLVLGRGENLGPGGDAAAAVAATEALLVAARTGTVTEVAPAR